MTDYWFTKSPEKICADLGLDVGKNRAKELSDFFDGHIFGWYYLSSASIDGNDEAAKWILNYLSPKLKEKKWTIMQAERILPADYLHWFLVFLKEGKFDKVFSKDILDEISAKGVQFEVLPDHTCRRVYGKEIIERVIQNPKYKSISVDEIADIVKSVLEANSDKIFELKNDKIFNWFVGQCMKACKGKANAEVIRKILEGNK